MLGAGHSPLERKIIAPGTPPPYKITWTSLDFNAAAKPDVVFDLDRLHYEGKPLPFEPETFSEIHAYEVLEHVGQQGNFRGFFREFREYWRILKPGGRLIGTTPDFSVLATFGDPGHVRVINWLTLSYLCPAMYRNLGKDASSDYRSYVDPCWWVLETSEVPEGTPTHAFAIRKILDPAEDPVHEK
jgi:SAM-dependent methyltransferase